MSDNPECPKRQSYRVRTGLMELLVEAEGPDQAITIAREQLCLELPRLWDVIQAMEDARFRVTTEPSATAELSGAKAATSLAPQTDSASGAEDSLFHPGDVPESALGANKNEAA